jgi:hypothetical protein
MNHSARALCKKAAGEITKKKEVEVALGAACRFSLLVQLKQLGQTARCGSWFDMTAMKCRASHCKLQAPGRARGAAGCRGTGTAGRAPGEEIASPLVLGPYPSCHGGMGWAG